MRRNLAAKGRRDRNQAAIAQVFRQFGAHVKDAASLGTGFPDLIVLYRDVIRLVEVKTRTGRLSAAQKALAAVWPVSVVRSIDDAEAFMREWR